MIINKFLSFYLLYNISFLYILSHIDKVSIASTSVLLQFVFSIFAMREVNNHASIQKGPNRVIFLGMMYIFPIFGGLIFLKSMTKQKIKIKTDLLKSFILYLFILGAFNNFLPNSIGLNALKLSVPPTVEFIFGVTNKNEMIANQTVENLSSCNSEINCEQGLISLIIRKNKLTTVELVPLFGMHFAYSLAKSKALGTSKDITVKKLKKLLNFYSTLIPKKVDQPISTLVLAFSPMNSLEGNSLTLVKRYIGREAGQKFKRKKDNFIDSY